MNRPPLVRRRVPNRSGYTLLELLTIIAVSSLIMGFSTVMLQKLLRVDRQLHRSTQTTSQVNQLQHLFRQDVHDSLQSELTSDAAKQELRLKQLDDVVIQYDAVENRLTRTQLRRGLLQHREQITFPLDTTIAIRVEGQGRKIRLTLLFDRMPPDQPKIERLTSPPRELSLVAIIGDSDFVSDKESQQ